jgi:hypothetical protein
MNTDTHFSIWGYGPTICGKSTKFRKLKVTTHLGEANCEACNLVIRTIQDPIKDELKSAIQELEAKRVVMRFKHHRSSTSPHMGATICGLGGVGQNHLSSFMGDVTCPRCIRSFYENRNNERRNPTGTGVWTGDEYRRITGTSYLPGTEDIIKIPKKADWERERMGVLIKAICYKRVAGEEVPDIWLEEYLDLWTLFNITVPEHITAIETVKVRNRQRREGLDTTIPPYITGASGGIGRQPTVTFGNPGDSEHYTLDFNYRHFWPRGYGRPICVSEIDEKYMDVPVYGSWGNNKGSVFCDGCENVVRKLPTVISD